MASGTLNASGIAGFDMDIFAHRLKDPATGECGEREFYIF